MMSEDLLPRPDDAPSGIYGSNGQPQFFDDPTMDRFVAVILNLASEVWVQEERIRALESDAGKTADEADPDRVVKAFIDRVFAPLRGA
jgi:hypothetical protein